MSYLNFLNYRVLDLEYVRKNDIDLKRGKPIKLQPKLNVHSEYDDKDSIVNVTLTLTGLENLPFDLKATIEGKFKYIHEEKLPSNYLQLIQNNAATILFPYLRSVISQITLLGNEYSPIILPLINVESLKEKHN
ncbi:protein-export chaperone SecB [Limosilactobacillus vaginalis]|uniref:protein-export chaperone SecB n=1 Tax=Limosilactobacillus vaginalis TaxID=1633 RepID=UPI002073D316|nr:protein-export chaperone SecB [Limosilactobacillus vaginalis]